ncbi:sulfatase-like hydrolase/transferase [Alcanivorax sp. 24]|uniref:sulfatase-like hydrolase/transferase n=1 Tax=Alcanivorax sp. 24 TaxID=2545266 RepID=UPI0014150A29|nr:sulfatase-like hydrolase/transferase [Alcanivorax sp. 24]
MNRVSHRLILTGIALTVSGCWLDSDSDTAAGDDTPQRPNILFVIMDDVGIDQMPSMGYGGVHPPSMPSIDAIAAEGVRFRNTWSMPECSPGRAALLAGSYPTRTHINQAIGPNDLANSQLSPYATTIPKLLKQAGYQSAMFGKFHLAGPEHNVAGNGTPGELGWDYFHGWTGGLPGSIDTTAGGVAPEGTYSCGFVPSVVEDPLHGAAFGACYVQSSEGTACSRLTSVEHGDSAGLQCLARGGILVPARACQSSAPAALDFERENAHYVSPLVINSEEGVEEAALTDPRGRGYRSTLEVDAARDWINTRKAGTPWMATVSFSAAHTPLQVPPGNLLPSDATAAMRTDCGMGTDNLVNQRLLTDALIEAMDVELGRLLVETGIAERGEDGALVYRPESDTVVVIVGDNGSLGTTVKPPFDVTRAKGTAYQTGVWVPLIIAGPMVAMPDRDVGSMVNAADVFHLFGEIAGLEVAGLIPNGHDGVSMLPYLLDPAQPTLRQYNFTVGGLNLQAGGGRNGPCVIATTCSHTPVNKAVCEDNGGVWWGVGADAPEVVRGDLTQCWQVNQAIYQDDPARYDADRKGMGWTVYQAVRDDEYKLVRNHALDYDIDSDGPIDVYSEEFYRIDQQAPTPRLDSEGSDLLAGGDPSSLSDEERARHAELSDQLDAILASPGECPGDGNQDRRVDEADLANLDALVDGGWSGSSVYDFNLDGVTDAVDRAVISDHFGPCP